MSLASGEPEFKKVHCYMMNLIGLNRLKFCPYGEINLLKNRNKHTCRDSGSDHTSHIWCHGVH